MKYSDGMYPGTTLSGSSHSNVTAMDPGGEGRSSVAQVVTGILGTKERVGYCGSQMTLLKINIPFLFSTVYQWIDSTKKKLYVHF